MSVKFPNIYERTPVLPRIACLHTAQSNVAVFDAALDVLKLATVTLHHQVRVDLLDAAERSRGLTPIIAAQTIKALRKLAQNADAVLLTCSTLGAAVEAVSEAISIPVMRADAALARVAVLGGGEVTVLCAVETTVRPTKLLFEEAARGTGAKISVQLVPCAWDAFKAGDRSRYLMIIAQAADEALAAGAAQVALAQASMAGATSFTKAYPLPLTSPAASLAAAIAATS